MATSYHIQPVTIAINFSLLLKIATLVFASWPSVVHDTGINKSWQRKLQNYIRQTLGNNYYPAGSGAESRN